MRIKLLVLFLIGIFSFENKGIGLQIEASFLLAERKEFKIGIEI